MKINSFILMLALGTLATACSQKAKNESNSTGAANNLPSPEDAVLKPGSATKNYELIPPEDVGTINWSVLGPEQGVEGVNSDLLIEAKSDQIVHEVVVAVIDGGVDVEHEDLQGKIWVNSKEVADNGIDDDNNGYTDDIHGWNYLGNAKGENIEGETLEVTRIYKRLQAKSDEGTLTDPAEIKLYEQVKKEVTEALTEAKEKMGHYRGQYQRSEEIKPILARELGVSDFSQKALEELKTEDPSLRQLIAELLEIVKENRDLARLKRRLDYYTEEATIYYNVDHNVRAQIVGDDVSDLTPISPANPAYGNNNVTGPDASHGTHVAGIIAANRDNGLGIQGVALKVKIMALRAVPNGDEQDKDVALAIRYAVDHGAKIINMSFGKSYSPYKSGVDEAVKYAADKEVVIFHAAGNSGLDLDDDLNPNFPNKYFVLPLAEQAQKLAENFVEVGASSAIKGLNLAADFSNYGRTRVDLFAPGVDIRSSVPGNEYDTYSGTSMAAPVASGVAALLLSIDPALRPQELKELMITTTRRYPKLNVLLPGTEPEKNVQVNFSNLSLAHGVVDALGASAFWETVTTK